MNPWTQSYIGKLLCTFFLSMVPVVELRGGIPLGLSLGLKPWESFLCAIAGNMLPVPFILLFIRRILSWMKTVRFFSPVARWVEEKGRKHSVRVAKGAAIGLVLFVGIPIPGTGAWTGALIAAMLDIRFRYALPAITAGVLLAGFIMAGASYGFLSALSFLL
mgnify:CR=1 FL=1